MVQRVRAGLWVDRAGECRSVCGGLSRWRLGSNSHVGTSLERAGDGVARRMGANQTVNALEQVAWLRGQAPTYIN